MPLFVRSTTLTAAYSAGGISVFTKSSDGHVREVRNNLNNKALAQSLSDNSTETLSYKIGWNPGTLDFKCSPDSTLCAIAWSDTAQSLFYQDTNGSIREYRLDNAQWKQTDFEQPGALPGTNIAAVHSEDGSKVAIFYQEKDSKLVYCRTATGRGATNTWTWNEMASPVSNTKANEGSGIGASGLKDLSDIHVFFQDEKKVIREFRGCFGRPGWQQVNFDRQYNAHIGDITAISWTSESNATEMRLYLQNEENSIVELANNSWGFGHFFQSALPNADVTAFVRSIPTQTGIVNCLCVLWVGQDQNVYLRASYPGSSTHADWMEPANVTSISNAGDRAGSWLGTYFSDQSFGIETKSIRTVHIRVVSEGIADIHTGYTDGFSTKQNTTARGKERKFVLEDGENIILIWYIADTERISALRFATSKGRESEWYGTKKQATPDTWSHNGDGLAGFCGALGSNGIIGLMPIWAGAASLSTVAEMTQEAKSLEVDMEMLSKTEIPELTAKISLVKKEMQNDSFRHRASVTMDGIVKLVSCAEYLYDLTQADKNARVTGEAEQRAKHIQEQLEVCKRQTQTLLETVSAMCHEAQTLSATSKQLHSHAAQIAERSSSKRGRLSLLLQSIKNRGALADKETPMVKKLVDDARSALAQAESALKNMPTATSFKSHTSSFGDSMFSVKPIVVVSPEERAQAERAVHAKKATLQQCIEFERQNDKLTADLEQASTLTDTLSQEFNIKGQNLLALAEQGVKLAGQAERLNKMLETLRQSGEAMTDNTTAAEYGSELYQVLRDALDIELLQDQLKVKPEVLIDTLHSIEKSAPPVTVN